MNYTVILDTIYGVMSPKIIHIRTNIIRTLIAGVLAVVEKTSMLVRTEIVNIVKKSLSIFQVRVQVSKMFCN